MSQPDTHQGTYDTTKVSRRMESAPAASDDTVHDHPLDEKHLTVTAGEDLVTQLQRELDQAVQSANKATTTPDTIPSTAQATTQQLQQETSNEQQQGPLPTTDDTQVHPTPEGVHSIHSNFEPLLLPAGQLRERLDITRIFVLSWSTQWPHEL